MGSILTAVAWAVAGAGFYKISFVIINVGRYSLFAKLIVIQCLKLLGCVVEDLAFVQELKYLQLAKSGMGEEQIEFIKKVDDQALSRWKENSIKTFKTAFPGVLTNIVKFNNWEEAMKELDRLHKTS